MGKRTFLVDVGQLEIDENETLDPPMIAIDQTGTRWHKPEWDTPWIRLRPSDEVASNKTIAAVVKPGVFEATPL